jgi:hypothetical protein
MKTLYLFMFASALAMAACTHDGNEPGTDPGPGPGTLSVIEWANDMAVATEPDTVKDKLAIVVDTDDPRAFDGVIEIAKAQAAAAAAAGD